MSQSFQLDLSTEERGVLWGLWQAHRGKLSGVLVITSSSSHRTDLRKEVAFLNGEPSAIRSNFTADSLRQYCNRVDRTDLANLCAELSSQIKTEDFVQEAITRQLLDASAITQFLGDYFRDRLFNLLTLRRGKLEFKEVPDLDEKEVKPEIVRLSEGFEKAVWEEIGKRFDENYCRSRFSKRATDSFKLNGEFPLPLAPHQLRVWRSLLSRELQFSQLKGIELQMVTAAIEFGQIRWLGSAVEKWEKELQSTQKRFQGADPFQILGVSEEADEAEAKKRYLEYVKKYHPDRMPADLPDQLRGLAELILSQVNEAFSIVSDPERKSEFLAQKQFDAEGGMEGVEKKLKAEFAFEEARLALKRRHFAKALDQLDAVYGFMAEDLEFQVERAYAQMMRDAEAKQTDRSKYPGYHQIFDKAVEMRPDYANAFYYKGILLKLEHQFDQALAYFDQAFHLDDKLQEALSEARYLRMKKDKEKSKSKSWFRKKS